MFNAQTKWENKIMKTPLEFIHYYLLRFLATLLDILLIACIFRIFFLAFSYMKPGGANEFINFIFPISALIWILLEAQNGSTLGKRALGLQLEIYGNYSQRAALLLLRNFFKSFQVVISFLLSALACANLHLYNNFSSQDFGFLAWAGLGNIPLFILIVPCLLGLTLAFWLNLYRTDRHLQDWVCRTRVSFLPQHQPVFQTVTNLAGMLATCALVLWLSVTAQPAHPIYSSVKANMHTLQTIVETYAVDWGGVYPADVEALKIEATQAGREYWKEFTNPFSGQSGEGLSYGDATHVWLQKQGGILRPHEDEAGLVLYAPVKDCRGIIKYFIYGLDKKGQTVKDRGRDFVLSNS